MAFFKPKVKEGDLFQDDNVKSDRTRGDKKQITRKRMYIESLILFGVIFFLVYVIVSAIVGLVWAVIQSLLANEEFLHKLAPHAEAMSFKEGRHGMMFHFPQLILPFLVALGVGLFFTIIKMRYDRRRIATTDQSDVQTHKGDRKILSTDEVTTRFEPFPDRGAHSRSVSPTAIISHIFLKNSSRLGTVMLYERNEDGSYKHDANGKLIEKKYPMIDESDQPQIYDEALGIKNKKEQVAYDPFKVPYKKDEKGKPISLGDFIKKDWYIPPYENQRPTGAFLVETGAVNSFVIAITRGNKGQLAVNNSIDNLSRESDPQNMFVNDPKGELFAAFHQLLENRGYEVVVLNLLNYSMTHQFNVLGPGISNARIGDLDKMETQLSTIINTFFPVEGDDPFWGQAQQALVRMIIFAMIDYYIEEEREYIRLSVDREDLDEASMSRDLDNKWRHVTMYNAYQMLTVMSRKEVWFNEEAVRTGKMYQNGKLISQRELANKEIMEEQYDLPPSEQVTQLTAFFKLMSLMPDNKMRTMTLQQNDAMKLMADSEKTRATVYGIALVAMLFFTRRPITAITSASPHQSLDPLSLPFPRRLRFKFNIDYIHKFNLKGQQLIFESFRDPEMTDKIEDGDDFEHRTRVDELGWVEYRFKGIYDEYDVEHAFDGSEVKIPRPIYIKMTMLSANGLVMDRFYFEFKRGYAKTADGKQFLGNPRTGERIEKDGTLYVGQMVDGTFKRTQDFVDLGDGHRVLPIEQTDPVYNVKPKAIFSITPPHLLDYVKIIIVMVSVLFDTGVGESYVTKASGKPLYKTRYILDELGNLQYNGNGIPGFQTKLSIGLGQGQEFLMVLQTLQQLRDVYGDSIDKIVSSNTAVLMYLISNDMDMLEDLSKIAGSTHVARQTGKTYSKKHGAVELIDENISYNVQENEERLFTVDELMSFTNGEAMVLTAVTRQGNSGEAVRPNPVHDTKDRLLPMAWALHKDGHNSNKFKTEFSNAEVATSVVDNDVIDDMPNFSEMYEKRLIQASLVNEATEQYQKHMNVSEDELLMMDNDSVANEIMKRISSIMNGSSSGLTDQEYESDDVQDRMKEFANFEDQRKKSAKETVPKEDQKHQGTLLDSKKERTKDQEAMQKPRYFNLISYEDLKNGQEVKNTMTKALAKTVKNLRSHLNDNLYHIDTVQEQDVNGEMSDVNYVVSNEGNHKVARLGVDDSAKGLGAKQGKWTVEDDFITMLRNIADNGNNGFSYSENKDQPSVDERLLATKDQVEKYFAFTKDNNPNVVDKFKDLFNKEIINGQNSDE